jgi:hypothetical protein
MSLLAVLQVVVGWTLVLQLVLLRVVLLHVAVLQVVVN